MASVDGRTRPILFGIGVAALGIAVAAVVVTSDGCDKKPAYYGVNAPLLRAYDSPGLEEKMEAVAGGMREQGIGWARVGLDQAVEQSDPRKTDWATPDAVVAALARNGVRTDALFLGTSAGTADPSALEACGKFSYPADTAAWARFVEEAVERYGSTGAFWDQHPELERLPIRIWEIGNEENLRMFWCPGADPEHYAAVYRASRKAALAADPTARVIVGGLAPIFTAGTPGDLPVPEFLQRMVAADPGLKREIPAVAIHPYAATPSDVLDLVRLYREAMRAAALGNTPMIINEVGWYTSGPRSHRQTSESARADRIAELAAVIDRTNCGIDAFAIHAWLTAERDPENPEDWYGIADPATGDPRESASAYGEAISGEGSGVDAALIDEAARLCG